MNREKIARQIAGYLPKKLVDILKNKIIYFDVWKKNYYSQFGEDAILRELFFHEEWNLINVLKDNFTRKPLSNGNGFFVDIGAFKPMQYSNTYLFYKQGWRGINIDATPGSMKIFDKLRPKDINLEFAVSKYEGEKQFYTWEASGWNTISEKHYKEVVSVHGLPKSIHNVIAKKLETILDEYLPKQQVIDFFNIDVEGHSLEVLESNNWNKYTPKFVLVEVEAKEIQEVLYSKEFQYLVNVGYKLAAWVHPTLIMKKA